MKLLVPPKDYSATIQAETRHILKEAETAVKQMEL